MIPQRNKTNTKKSKKQNENEIHKILKKQNFIELKLKYTVDDNLLKKFFLPEQFKEDEFIKHIELNREETVYLFFELYQFWFNFISEYEYDPTFNVNKNNEYNIANIHVLTQKAEELIVELIKETSYKKYLKIS